MLATKRDQLLRLVPALPLHEEVMAFLIDKEAQGLSVRTMDVTQACRAFLNASVAKACIGCIHALLLPMK